MFKKISFLLLVLATIFMFASCVSSKNADKTESAEVEDLSTGTPWIDSQVIGGIKPDMQFDLKDDFAAANNKDWFLNAQLQPGYPYCGGLIDIAIQTQNQLFNLVTGPNKDNDPDLAKVQTFYNLFMDWDARNKLGVTPLMPTLKKLDAIQTIADLNAFSVKDAPKDSFVALPYVFSPSVDRNDSTRYTIYVASSGLIMGDSAEYSNPTEYGKMVTECKLDLARKMLGKVGYSKERTEEIINNTLAFETAIAPSIYTSDEGNSPDFIAKTNNPVTREQLTKMEGKVPIVETVLAYGVSNKDFTDAIVMDPKWLASLNDLYVDANATKIRDYIILHYVLATASVLDKESFDWLQEMSNTLTGVTESQPIELQAADCASSMLGWPLAKAYCNLYAKPEDKERIAKLCSDIKEEYKKMIQEEDFLSESTRAYAIEKVDALVVHSLYPDDDEWPDYSALTIKSADQGGSFFEAFNAITDYSIRQMMDKLGTKTNRERWNDSILPSTMNAFNYSVENAVYILTAICQNNVYNTNMSTEELYAGIGSIIGHEFSHSFDSSGAQFDKTGTLGNWWTEEDYKVFLAKNQKMTDYYNTISPWAGEHVHGEIVTGEAGADMAGVKVILRLADKIPGFDYDKFFKAFASVWQMKSTKQNDLSNIMSDVHPLSYLRINVTLAQFDKFQQTYGIKPGDGMYIAPEDRVIVW